MQDNHVDIAWLSRVQYLLLFFTIYPKISASSGGAFNQLYTIGDID